MHFRCDLSPPRRQSARPDAYRKSCLQIVSRVTEIQKTCLPSEHLPTVSLKPDYVQKPSQRYDLSKALRVCLTFWPNNLKERLFCLASNASAGAAALVWSSAEPNISIIHFPPSQGRTPTCRCVLPGQRSERSGGTTPLGRRGFQPELLGVYLTGTVSALGKHTGGRRLTKQLPAHFTNEHFFHLCSPTV